MNNINHLIISNTHDYSTDLICIEMEKRKINYLRLNRDCFANYEIEYNLQSGIMTVRDANFSEYVIDEKNLRSIYFRAPVFIRSNSKKRLSLDEQLYQSQWSAFIRNLIVFDKAIWINNPVDTYRAENKMFQLKIARDEGILVPKTIVANHKSTIEGRNKYIVKSLDTALFYDNEDEMFTYANVVTGEELAEYNLIIAPFFLQEYLEPKIDIRVTIIGDRIFPVKILKNGNGINGDWRKEKDNLEYIPFDLSVEISDKILNLMRKLRLNFGGMDLAIFNNEYYFIEVNPTGEWGWIDRSTALPISETIVDYLSQK